MKNSKLQFSFFLRFLLSFFIILLLPTVILYFVMMRTTIQTLRENIADNEVLLCEMLENNLSTELASCSEVVRSLSFYQEVEPFELQRVPAKAADLLQNISKHHTSASIADDIFVHFACDEYFYSTMTVFSTRSFLSHFDISPEQGIRLINKMNKITEPFSERGFQLRQPTSDSTRDSYILYVLPYEFNGETTGATIFAIRESKLNRFIGNMSDSSRITYLVDANKYLLNSECISKDILQQVPYFEVNQILDQAIAGKRTQAQYGGYSIVAGSIPKTNLFYVHFVLNGRIFSDLYSIQKRYLVLLIVLLTVGAMVTLLLAYYNYKPIRLLKALVGDTNTAKSSNELEQFASAYSNLKLTNDNICAELGRNAAMRKDYLLGCLLNGSIPSRSAFLEQCEEIGLQLDARVHFVAILRDEPVDSLYNYLRQRMPALKPFLYEYRISITGGGMIYLVGINVVFSPEFLYKINGAGRSSEGFAIGVPKEDLLKIPDSYIAARWAAGKYY